MSDPVLTKPDRDSAAWLKVMKYLEGRLATLRSENDADLTPEKTAKLRGKIAEVKLLMKMNADVPVIEDENAKFRD